MNKFFPHIIIVVVLMFTALSSSAQYYGQYEAPNAMNFLPTYPEYQSTRFSLDTKQYFYGKEVKRNDPVRGPIIKSDSPYGVENLASIYSHYLGIEISYRDMPQLWTLLRIAYTTAGYGADIKKKILRTRPCVKYNEAPYSLTETLTELKKSYSYPSAHTVVSWADGMIMAAMTPHIQDSILERSFDYGQSRVYGGMHWQSDVTDARYIASASVAHMLNKQEFKDALTRTRKEMNKIMSDSLNIPEPDYDAENYYDVDHLPNPLIYIPKPEPLDSATVELAYDMSQYVWGKSIRTTDRGIKAKFDISRDFDVLVKEFAHVIGKEISETHNPSIYNLVKMIVTNAELGCKKAQDEYQRTSPFVFFNDGAFTFENSDYLKHEGSFPSVSSAKAWAAALAMVAIEPEKQDTLLKVGYELGESAVIAGINWQSDVDAGRLVASAVLARCMSNPNFIAMLETAQEEYTNDTRHIVTDQEDITQDKAPEQKNPFYTLDGRLANKDSKGILVSKNKKVLK